MLTKRIIPCLDIKDGRVVKGINFLNLRDAGDPVETASVYGGQGADELVFLDITATIEKRKTLVELVRKVSGAISIPFTVGGGVRGIDDITNLLRSGADKVSINSAAVKREELIRESSEKFGSQCIIIAIDAKKNRDGRTWNVYIDAGSTRTDMDVLEWARKAEKLGAGEILLTSMDADGTKQGYDVELTRAVSSLAGIPVIASGGAGSPGHIYDVLTEGGADAALAASIFHYGQYPVPETKRYLKKRGIKVRI